MRHIKHDERQEDEERHAENKPVTVTLPSISPEAQLAAAADDRGQSSSWPMGTMDEVAATSCHRAVLST